MNRTPYFFIVAAGLFLLVMYNLYGAFLVGAAAVIAPLPGLIIAHHLKKKFKVLLTLPHSISRGTAAAAQLTVTGPVGWIPSFTAQNRGEAIELSEGNRNLSGTIPFEAPHCGIYEEKGITLTYTDYFSLKTFHLPVNSAVTFVMPRAYGDTARILDALRILKSPSEMEYYGATTYKPGDNPRLINWKVSARKDEVFVRESIPSNTSEFILAAENSENDDKRDTIGDTLLSIGLAMTRSGKSFHFLWLHKDGKTVKTLITRESEFLTSLREFLTYGECSDLLTSAEHEIPRGFPVLLITGRKQADIPSSIHPAVWSADSEAAANLAGRNAIVNFLGGDVR